MLYRVLDIVERWLIIACLGGIAVLTFAGVLSRFLFHYSIAWAEELVRYLFLWGALLGAAAAFRHGGHAGIPFLVEKLPPAGQRWAARAVSLMTALFFIVLARNTYDVVALSRRSGQISPATGVPYWVVNVGLMAGIVLAAIRSLETVFRPPADKDAEDAGAEGSPPPTDSSWEAPAGTATVPDR